MTLAEIEKIIRNNFQRVNKDGMGFLESEIKKMCQRFIHYNK